VESVWYEVIVGVVAVVSEHGVAVIVDVVVAIVVTLEQSIEVWVKRGAHHGGDGMEVMAWRCG